MNNLKEIVSKIFQHPDKFGELVGYQLDSLTEDKVLISLVIHEDLLSPVGVAHGGVIATLIDFSMGAAIFSRLNPGELCSTIEFKVNYLSPVQLGEKICCESKLKFKGRSHAVTECHVYREAGKDVAFAMGTYNIY